VTSVERDRNATEARLIGAVEDLIVQQGFGAIGINAVARQAGADKVLIYRYFGGLSGLLAAYAEEGDFWWTVEDLLREPLPAPMTRTA
jgi:AcrR family transcriptional regulator